MFPQSISASDRQALKEAALKARGAILSMTTLAASGHPGGSMSSIDMLIALYKYANISPSNCKAKERDKIITSIGHISPAVYAALGEKGFFNTDEAISQFRLAGSLYEGHIERLVTGVEWTTGNLGQGLSVACGLALTNRIKNTKNNIFVIMGDGEHQKGQISEARRFAAKYKLAEITVLLDHNRLQISGDVSAVMPQNFAAEYESDGWAVFTADGHDFDSLISALREAQTSSKPTLIIASTVMGKGVSFMENKAKYHGSPLSTDDYKKAMAELGLKDRLDEYKKLRDAYRPNHHSKDFSYPIKTSDKTTYYTADIKTDCRSAFGTALEKLVADSETPIAVFDCDLAGSVKTGGVEKSRPDRFFQAGISEHHTATMAGALSSCGIITFFAGFTMFAVDEVYNQLRLNDINFTNLKVVSTHAGIDGGEDGRTHQCIDYLGLMRNLFGFRLIAPADPNQTDHAVRYAAGRFGNFHIVMGRSKLPVITDEGGKPLFGEDYKFEYGKIDEVRKGKYPLLSYGTMLARALKVRELGADIGVYNVSTPLSPDNAHILKLAKVGKIFVYEDHISASGLYATICEILASEGVACKVIPFGVKAYPFSGTPDDIFKLMELSPEIVAKKIKEVTA